MESVILFYHFKYLVHAIHVTWKIKTAVNDSKDIMKNYSPVDKSLVVEYAGEENSDKIKHLRLIT